MSHKTKLRHEIISGPHSVKEALEAGRRTFSGIYCSRPLPARIADLAADKSIPVFETTPQELMKLSGTDQHQHVAAKVTPFRQASLAAVISTTGSDTVNPGEGPLYLVIDSVEDPRNLGALIRTAVCAGVAGVILPRDRCAPLSPAVSRASAGAMEHCAICRVTNLVDTINVLKKHGVWVTGLDHKSPLSIFDTDMTGPHAIVTGGEHTGIRRLVAQNCDMLCRIPQFGRVGSLNASVAGAIGMYEALRQKQAVKKRATS